MTKRLVSLGGTNYSDGEVLYAADKNDTENAMVIRYKKFMIASTINNKCNNNNSI